MPDGSEVVPHLEWNRMQMHQNKFFVFVNNKLGMVDSSNSFKYKGDVFHS